MARLADIVKSWIMPIIIECRNSCSEEKSYLYDRRRLNVQLCLKHSADVLRMERDKNIHHSQQDDYKKYKVREFGVTYNLENLVERLNDRSTTGYNPVIADVELALEDYIS